MLKIDFSTRTFEAEIKGDLQEIIKLADAYLSDALQQGVGQAVQRVPTDTGFLKNSIGSNRLGELDYTFFAAEFYAPFVEFGTGTGVRIPTGYEELARESGDKGIATGRAIFGYKGGKFRPNNRAQPFLIPAFEAAIDRFEKDFNDINV